MQGDDEKNELAIQLIAEQLGASEQEVRESLASRGFSAFAADSLDVLELIMELADEQNSGGDDE